MAWLEQQLRSIDGGQVLDVGTGRGQFVAFMMEALGSYEVITGVDIVDPFVTVDPALRESEGLHWVHADGASLPFPDASFDTVSIANSLHHLKPDSVGDGLREMVRVLKSGGRFLLVEMFRDAETPAQQVHVALHHWTAEVDRLLGVEHNPTMPMSNVLYLVRRLPLAWMYIHKEGPEEAVPADTEGLELLEAGITRTLARMEGRAEYPRLNERAGEIRRMLREDGFALAPSVLMVGAK